MVKVLISIDDSLLEKIDRAARRAGLSRSAYLASLAERETADTLADADRSRREAVRRLRRLFEDVPPGDATAEIREMRDTR